MDGCFSTLMPCTFFKCLFIFLLHILARVANPGVRSWSSLHPDVDFRQTPHLGQLPHLRIVFDSVRRISHLYRTIPLVAGLTIHNFGLYILFDVHILIYGIDSKRIFKSNTNTNRWHRRKTQLILTQCKYGRLLLNIDAVHLF